MKHLFSKILLDIIVIYFCAFCYIGFSHRMMSAVAKNIEFSDLAKSLIDKSVTKEQLLINVKSNFGLISLLLTGVSYSKASVRYGCAKVLMDLSKEHPEKLYPYFEFFINLLESKYRILKWNALTIIANLTRVDVDKKFDAFFNKYYNLLNDGYMVTVANVVGNSINIALGKPYLISKITDKLLTVKYVSLTPHLTEECRRVIAQQTIKSFDQFFDQVEQKEKVLSFVRTYVNSPRLKLKKIAEAFIEKWT